MSQGIKSSDPNQDILYVSFNQDASCISVGTRHGYRIYNCEPFGKCFHEAEGGIGIVQMLFCTSLVALVGAGDQPAISPRRLRIWNTKTTSAICDLNFVTAILSCQLNRQRLVVVLEKKIHIFDINTMQILETLVTASNPKGLCVLSPSDNGHMAFPTGASPGELLLYDANNLSVLNAIQSHLTAPTALAFNKDGSLLATASETGTIIRVFSVPAGRKLHTLRRGMNQAIIYCLSFDESSNLLCASSNTGTIHIFSLNGSQSSTTGSFGAIASLSSNSGIAAEETHMKMSSYLPSSWTNIGIRDFAYARLRDPGVPNLCAITSGHGDETGQLLVITADGYFYQFSLDILKGGECRLERENVLRDSTSEEIAASYIS